MGGRSSFLKGPVKAPFRSFGGPASRPPPEYPAAFGLGAQVHRAPALDPERIDDVILGNANGAGEDNRDVARMAVLLAGLPLSVPGVTVNRLCGSSLEAAIQAARAIETGDASVVIAGGVESMSRAPWVMLKPDKPFPTGDAALVSTTLGWRLVNPRMQPEWTVSLGEATERLAERYQVDRERQDEFALASHAKADAAWREGRYASLVAPYPGVDLDRDEGIRADSSLDKLASLKPVFRPDGTVTAGNASPLNDGASALLLGSEEASDVIGLAPLARIAGRAAVADEPQFFGYAPVEAANRALAAAGIGWKDVGAVELNEAFAAQALACIDAWDVDPQIVNGWGGAIAIGHPLGASGGRILGTLARRMEAEDARWGVAAICIGVGQGLAVVLERA
nr:MAG: 3-oxoadipyl-CoA thiolase [Actinomycetota bacterium]